MKKRILINKENLVKRLTGTIALASATIAVTLSTACTEEEMNQAIDALNQISTEQETPEQTPEVVEIPIEEPEVEVEEPEVEEVEEINPRDMKAVYGLDFDVPIYTEEEVEQAKENLRTKYEGYHENYSEELSGFTDEQIAAIKDDYYIANQDFFYKLYSLTKDIDWKAEFELAYDGNIYYYDSENDWMIELSKYKDLYIYGENFTFVASSTVDKYTEPNTICYYTGVTIGPGSYAIIEPHFYTEKNRTRIIENISGNITDPKYDVGNLKDIGFISEKVDFEYTDFGIQPEKLILE